MAMNCRDKQVGNIGRITIGHNNRGLGAAWCLAQVQVKDMATGLEAVFTYNDWIPSKGDNRNPILLTATSEEPPETTRYAERAFGMTAYLLARSWKDLQRL
jgi:hypothetical protein